MEIRTKDMEHLVFPTSTFFYYSLWLVSIPIWFDNRNTGEANWKQLEDGASRGQGKVTSLRHFSNSFKKEAQTISFLNFPVKPGLYPV